MTDANEIGFYDNTIKMLMMIIWRFDGMVNQMYDEDMLPGKGVLLGLQIKYHDCYRNIMLLNMH